MQDDDPWDGSFEGVANWQRRMESTMPLWDKLRTVDSLLASAAMINPTAFGHLAAPLERQTREAGPVYVTAGESGTESIPLPFLRRRADLKQGELAERIGCSKSAVSQFERGRSVTTDMLKRYLTALGAELELVARFPDGRKVGLTLGPG